MQLFKILTPKDDDWLKGPQNRYEFPLPSSAQQQLMAKALHKAGMLQDASALNSLPRMQSGDPISYGYISGHDSKDLKKKLIKKGLDFLKQFLNGAKFNEAPIPLALYADNQDNNENHARIWQLQVIPQHYIFIVDAPHHKEHWDQAELDQMSDYLQGKLKEQAYVTVIEASSDADKRQDHIRETCDHYHFHPIKGCCMKEGGCIDCLKGGQHTIDQTRTSPNGNLIQLNNFNP